METPSQVWRFRMVSLVIVVVLGLQLFAVLAHTAKGWPFIDYPMYATSHQEGDRLPVELRLYASIADGTEVLITPSDLGLKTAWPMYSFWVLSALRSEPPKTFAPDSWRAALVDQDKLPSWVMGDRKSPERAVAFILERYDQLHKKDIVKLRLEDYGVIVTRQGLQRVPPQVLWTWTVPVDGGPQ